MNPRRNGIDPGDSTGFLLTRSFAGLSGLFGGRVTRSQVGAHILENALIAHVKRLAISHPLRANRLT